MGFKLFTKKNYISNLNNYGVNKIIVDFLEKFFFILNAAAKGWNVKYIGGNKFKFSRTFLVNEVFPIIPNTTNT